MFTEAALIHACRLDPDDDGPRLVWADHIGGERGELVVVQCQLARGGRSPAVIGALLRRERQLLQMHGTAWAALSSYATRWQFRRGFVEAAEIDAATFVARHGEIFAAAPLLHSLTVTGLAERLDGLAGRFDRGLPPRSTDETRALMSRLIECPGLRRLDGLELAGGRPYNRGAGGVSGPGDDLAAELASSGPLAQLRALGFWQSELSPRGVHALVASGKLGQLERLRVRREDIGIDAAIALIRAAPRLVELDLGVPAEPALSATLGPLIALRVAIPYTTGLPHDACRALCQSRAAATLESLAIDGNFTPANGFTSFPQLRVLDLAHARHPVTWTGSRFDEFVATPLPALRRLTCPQPRSRDALLAIGHALGPQLELLDLRRARPQDVAELAPRIAGQVVIGESSDRLPFLLPSL